MSYAGEVATCHQLADPGGLVAELQRLVHPYPPALREALLDRADAVRTCLARGGWKLAGQ